MNNSRSRDSESRTAGRFGQQRGQPAPNKDGHYPAEPLTPAEVAALIGQCSRRAPTGIRNRAMITLLYRSGLRVSELLGGGDHPPLKPSDVNLDTHSIRLLDTKSQEPQTRGFHPSADDALLRWLDERKRQAAARGWKNGPLFCTLEGSPLSEDYLRGLLRRLAAKAGIDKRVHPHGLRHTFAVELEQAGTPVTTISKLLGHSSVAVTARYLDHLTNHQAVSALQSVELPEIAPDQGSSRSKRGAERPRKQPGAPATQVHAPEPPRPSIEPLEPPVPQPAPATEPEPHPEPACPHPSSARDWETGRCGACGREVSE